MHLLGHLEVQVGKQTKTFGITRAHLEEDAGTSIEPVSFQRVLLHLAWGMSVRFCSLSFACVD